jgi:23S rRNA (adenine-N6)-dimethyltransferase
MESHSQNFITDATLVQKLLDLTDISTTDTVIEIGAGKGIITQKLAQKCKNVVALEIDKELMPKLSQTLSSFKNVTLINDDFLNAKLPKETYKVFSNIPFEFTSRIMSKLFFEGNPPKSSYLIMQNEAANIYLGKPRETQKSLLLKPLFSISIFYQLNKWDFKPMPAVDSEMLEIKKLTQPLLAENTYTDYKDFVVYGTGQSKLTLKRNLNKIFTGEQFYRLSQNLGFDKEAKPLDLNCDQWLGLFKYYQTNVIEEKKVLVQRAFEKHLIVQAQYKKRFKTRVHK